MIEYNKLYLSQNKIFTHMDRLEEWLEKGITKPIMIEIDLTNKCNHNCKYCAGNRTKALAELDYSFIIDIINQVSSFCKGIVFTGGGEPLIHKDIIKIIEYTKSKSIDIGLITNGELITKEISKIILNNCTWVRISLDGNNKEEYSLIRQVPLNTFDKVIKNIKLLSNLKKKLKSKCTVGVGYLVNNKSDIFKMSKLIKSTGADYIQFRPYHYTNVNIDEKLNKCKQLETNKFKIMSTIHRFHKEIGTFERCYRDEFTTVISAEGKMYPCCFTRGIESFELGDLNKDTFETIWNSKKRQKINKTKLLNPKCPIMVKYDTLNKILWNIYKINNNKTHINFI